MQYGLSQETIQKINLILKNFKEVQEAILYGSRAKGNYKPGSDIDITLRGEGIDLHLLNKISLHLDDLFLPYIFDFSIYTHINNQDLIQHIQRIGKVLYKKND